MFKKICIIVFFVSFSAAASENEVLLQDLRADAKFGQILLQAEQVLVFNGYKRDGDLVVKWDQGNQPTHTAPFVSVLTYKSDTAQSPRDQYVRIAVEGTYLHAPNGNHATHVRAINIDSKSPPL